MDVYVYAADIYCEDCGPPIRDRITSEGHAPADPDDESTYDSGEFPKGPYSDGGGEADCPRHCGACGVFLENPLTPEGERYVRETLASDQGNPDVRREWSDFYGIPIPTAEDRENAARFDALRDSAGKLPAFAWPGGYPIYYLCADNGILCPACANGENGSEASPTSEDRQWRLVAQEAHWEGEPLTCDHCNAEIESAYGPVESDDSAE